MSNGKSIEAVYLATVTQIYPTSSLNPVLYTGKVENFHGHVNFDLQYVNIDLHYLQITIYMLEFCKIKLQEIYSF